MFPWLAKPETLVGGLIQNLLYVLTLIRHVEQHFCTLTIFVTSGNSYLKKALKPLFMHSLLAGLITATVYSTVCLTVLS